MRNSFNGGYINSLNPKEGDAFPFLIQRGTYREAFPRKAGFRVMHWHEDLQFTLVVKGQLGIVSPGKKYILKAGQGIFINRRVLHQFLAEPGCENFNYIFPLRFLKFLADDPSGAYVDSFIDNESVDFVFMNGIHTWQKNLFRILLHLERLEAEFLQEPETRSFPAYAYEVLLSLCRGWLLLRQNYKTEVLPSRYTGNRQMYAMLFFIETHYSEQISLEQIARAGNVSKSGCLRSFRMALQVSPYRYLLNYRLARAEEMLRETDAPISQIAENAGFHQYSYFSSEFRKQFDMTPREYRKHYKLD